MATPTPSRASSRSPRRNPNADTPSSHSSPRRGPLLERSDSQNNSIYRQTPFPTLPSQVFAPKGGDLYVFGDSGPSPSIPPKSPSRISHSSGSWSAGSPPTSRVPPPLFSAAPSPQASAIVNPDAAQRSNVRRRTSTSASKSLDNASAEAASTGIDTGESSQMAVQRATIISRRPLALQASTESFAARTRRQHGVSDQSQASIPHHRSIERLRSQSSVGSLSKARRRAQTGHLESSRSSEDRPRSSSSPSTPTDAFIKALISSGTNVQYPKLRKSSATSLRSESTAANAVYPPPLRLQRKRANSQLAKAASVASQSLEPLHSATNSSTHAAGLRGAPSQTSFMTHTSDGTSTWGPSYFPHGSAYGHWDAELEDTVTELHPRSLKRQRSDNLNTPKSQSGKTSRESLRSSVGSFYHFLNDSRTAWAQVYYRGEGKLRLETPPGVEDPTYLEPPEDSPQSSPRLGQGHSPGSGGFPDQIYVPRVRPFARHGASDQGNGQSSSHIRMVPLDPSSPYNKTDTDSSIAPATRPWPERSSSGNGTPETDSSTVPQMRTFWQSSSSPYNSTETDSNTGPRRHFSPRTYSSEERSSSVSRNRPLMFDSTFSPFSMAQDSSHSHIHPAHRDGFSFATSDNNQNDDAITALPPVEGIPEPPLGSPIFNPTPEVPHLSPSKRHGPGLPYWRTPSFDESAGPFDKGNVQLALFCIGFLLPPAWWIAAFCPIPKRPQWDRTRTGARVHKEQSVDLFNSIEVYRYQKARWWRNLNRLMALVGVLIVAAVIACVVVATT